MEMLTFVISIDGKLITDPLLLARIFHTDRDEGAAKAYGIRQTSILMPGCMCPYRPSHNVSLAQDPSDFPVSTVDKCEICGLAQFQISHQSFDLNSIHNAQEISVILLPIILGGHKRPTITGSVGPFLKTQEEWVLLTKRVIKNVCYLRYRKKSLPKAKGPGVSA